MLLLLCKHNVMHILFIKTIEHNHCAALVSIVDYCPTTNIFYRQISSYWRGVGDYRLG